MVGLPAVAPAQSRNRDARGMHPVAGGFRAAIPRARLLAGCHAVRPVGSGDCPPSGQDRARLRRPTHQLRGLGERSIGSPCRFSSRGIAPLDRVVVQLPNGPEFVYTYLRAGAHRRHSGDGAARAPAHRDPPFRARFRRHRLRHSRRGSAASITGRWRRSRRPSCPALRTRVRGGRAGAGPAALCRRCSTRLPAAECRAALADVRPDPAEVATMLLSGGTTSLSKLIPRTHDDYVLNARLCGAAGRLRRGHGVHGHPAAGTQLQPRLARHARHILLWRHGGACALRRRGRGVLRWSSASG